MNKLILIDGYGFVFRAFHSMPALTRPSDNMPIGAVYGFTNMLIKLLQKNESTHVAVVLDNGGKNFRHDIDPNYKAHRPALPSELICQFPIIREVIQAFGIKSIEKSGFEADDLIATYAKFAKENGYEVTVVSSDKDLLQLLNHGITIYDGAKDKSISEENVLAKFGVSVKYLRDLLSLVGDSSDNIPGVNTIGPKTAAELINSFGHLNDIYNNLSSIKQDKRRQTLESEKPNAYLSYELVGLNYNAPMDYTLNELTVVNDDNSKIVDFVTAQGFKSLASKIRLQNAQVKADTKLEPIEFTDLNDFGKLKDYIPEIYYAGWLAFIIHESKLYLSFEKYNLRIIINEQSSNTTLFESDSGNKISTFLSMFEEILCSESILKITSDSKWLYKFNPSFRNIEDIAIIAYAVETGRNNANINSLIMEYYPSYDHIDSHAVYNIYAQLTKNLLQGQLIPLYQRIDKPLVKIIALMEAKGVMIDVKYLRELSLQFTLKVQQLEAEIFNLTGQSFNLASPKQMGEVLFEHLKLPGGKKSKSGAYATGVKILEDLNDQGFTVAALILKWREYSKLISTYTEALPKTVNPKTNRIHSTFLLTNTSTGRFASIEPNLQNIPIRTDEGSKIRKAFVASSGNQIVSADYSQIELRLLAHYANIETLKSAFRNNLDVHAITATQIFNVPIDQVTDVLRRQAKTINFGIIYGISGFGLAKRLGIPAMSAKKYIDRYFEQYPGIKDYMDRTVEFAKNHGYVHNVLGRKCIISDINHSNYNVRGFSQRAAINAPLQSGAADIIKKATSLLPSEISQYLILQIHDELLFEVPQPKVEELAKRVKRIMESAVSISVPLVVDIGIGDNWAEAH